MNAYVHPAARRVALLCVPMLLAATAVAQIQTVVPAPVQAVDADLYELEPFQGGSPGRVMYVLDGGVLISAGIPPVAINILSIALRNDNESGFSYTWAGGTEPMFTADISTSAVPHATPSPIFSQNHGPDRVRFFTGPLTLPPGSEPGTGSPGAFTVQLPVPGGFTFDPSNDLVLDLTSSGAVGFGWGPWSDVDTLADPRGTQVIATNGLSTAVVGGTVPVLEISWVPASGLFPGFDQDVDSGPSPLTVTFTDRSVSSDPAGVSLVEFDFETDGVIDATTNAGGVVSHNYPCGAFDVTIRATDSINGIASRIVPAAVIADPVQASFSQNVDIAGVGQLVSFAATSTPGATLAWDFDGDGNIDATGLAPTFSYTSPGTYQITLDATLACNSVQVTGTVEILADAVLAPRGASGGLTGFVTPPDATYFDVDVTNPAGYLVEGVYHRSTQTGAPHTLEVWAQTVPGRSVVGHEASNNFSLVAAGTATAPALANQLFLVDVTDFSLPPGITGIAVVSRTGGTSWFVNNAGQTVNHSDLSLTTHSSASDFDTAGNGLTDADSWAGGFAGGAVADLIPGFSADQTSGATPLLVQFTDTSVTNDLAGPVSWSWDLDGDGNPDSSLQDPSFTYTACGDFSVTLTVSDNLNGTRSLSRSNLIATDLLSVGFDQDRATAPVGGMVVFTYTGTPGATIAWDLNGDLVNDAVGTNASFSYTAPGSYSVTMFATRGCRMATATGTVTVVDRILAAPVGPGGNTVTFSTPPDASYLDLVVKEVTGITVTEIGFRSPGVGTPHTLEVWLRQGASVVGAYAPSNFTLVAGGTATPQVAGELFLVDINDFALPNGTHGLAIVTRSPGSSHTWYAGNSGSVARNADLEIRPQASSTNFDTTPNILTDPDSFAGAIAYSNGGAPPTPGTVAKFGDGCAGALGIPRILPGPQPPALGSTFAVRVTNLPAATVIHGGISNTVNATFGIPLPTPLGPLLGTAQSCVFRVSSEVILPPAAPDPFAEATVLFPVPTNPSLTGLTVYFQAVVFDGSVPGNLVLSDAWFAVVQ